ncbi:MAG: YfhO family protein, partial [Candidatus Omnitrophica bacterium]|nr:YfhO family protein [Candidatus Omnitrophota bacterium]
GFYCLRNPSKALFFAMFAASVLSGLGFTQFFTRDKWQSGKKALRFFSFFSGSMLGLFFLGRGALVVFKEQIITVAEWYAANHVFGRDFHRYDLATYLDKVHNFYDVLVRRSTLTNPFILISVLLCATAVVGCAYLSKKNRINSVYKGIFAAVIFCDIFVFSLYGTGFRGNIKSFDVLRPELPALFAAVSSDKGLFRILPYGIASGRLPNWAVPDTNAVYGVDSAGAYTPLVVDSYRQKLSGLEAVDNALGLLEPSPKALPDYKDILRFLNVKYIVSAREIHCDFAQNARQEQGVYLYVMKDPLPRAFMAEEGKGPVRILKKMPEIMEYGPGHAVISVDTDVAAMLVLSEFHYPGWSVTVDGRPAKLERFQDILMSVSLPPGGHRVVFSFR